MKNAFIIAISVLLISCSESPKPETRSLKDRLPEEGKEVFLSPLESSLDKLAEATLYDPRNVESEFEIPNGKLIVRVNNDDDTVYLEINLKTETGNETHRWFSQDGEPVYKSEHSFETFNATALAENYKEDYKFYFEDNGALISTYTRISFANQTHPKKWAFIELTPNHLNHIWSRKKLAQTVNVELR